MLERMRDTLCKAGRVMACHHFLYGLMTLLHVICALQLIDKFVMIQLATAIYLALAVKG